MNKKLYKIIYSAVIATLTCVLTMTVQVPAVHGYIHIGDSAIFIGVYLIGIYAIPAAAIGSMLADLFTGYVIYMLPTFVIKGLIAFICYLVIRKKDSTILSLIGSVLGSLFMVAGYLFVDSIILGYGYAAVVALPLSFIQAGFSVGISIIVITIMKKMKFKNMINVV